MFKFIKENIVDAIKEGLDEAKEEVAQEREQEKELSRADEIKRLNQITDLEKFITALAAPFRESIFNDWFTLFKDDDIENDKAILLHLYGFGDSISLTKSETKRISEQLKNSFDVKTESEILALAKEYLELLRLTSRTLFSYSKSTTLNQISYLNGYDALLISMVACLLVSSVDLKLLDKQLVLDIFSEITPEIKRRFIDWEEYSKQFLIEESIVGFNKGKQRKQLESDINNLITKPNSPWNNISW